MDLTGALLRAGAARPHVLVATMPGATAVRLAAEEQLRRRGWPAAMTPADADILLVAGDAVAPLAEVVEATWQAMPAPRARAAAAHPGEVTAALEASRVRLGDRTAQQALAATGPRLGPLRHRGPDGHRPDADTGRHGHDSGGGDHDHGHGDGDHAQGGGAGQKDESEGHGHGGMNHGREAGGGPGHGGGGHDHAAGGVEIPGGLPMADRGDDRDGLQLDQLHLPLGPVLPDWPAGLVLRVTLQGDVIQEAEPEVLGGGGGSFWDEPWRRAAAGEHVRTAAAARRAAASYLDSLGRFLAVAGWDAAAVAARRLRDEVLAGAPSGRLRRDADRFARRVTGSRVLAWLTGGLGVLTAAEAAAAGAAGPAWRAGGDVTARYRQWCADLASAAGSFDDASPLRPTGVAPPRGPATNGGAPSAGLVAVLPRLLAGTELAAARLIIASLDPDLDQLPALMEGGTEGDGH